MVSKIDYIVCKKTYASSHAEKHGKRFTNESLPVLREMNRVVPWIASFIKRSSGGEKIEPQ